MSEVPEHKLYISNGTYFAEYQHGIKFLWDQQRQAWSEVIAMSDDYSPLILDWNEDEFIPTEPELLPPKEETEEERNQRIWEAIQSVSQG